MPRSRCLLEETLGHHIQLVRVLHLGLEPGKRPLVNAVLEHLLFIGEIKIQRHNQLPPFLKFGPKARMTDFPVQAHSVSLMNQLARGDPLFSLSQAWQKNGGEGCSRADFQAPSALDKTREIYINAVVLSRLKTYFRAKAGVFCRCIRCRGAMPHAQGRFRPAEDLSSRSAPRPAPVGHRSRRMSPDRTECALIARSSSLVARLVSGFRQRVDEKCTLFVH